MTTRVHLLEEIALALPIERYREAFPSRRGAFLLDGGGHDRLARFAMLGAEPDVVFRASRLPLRRDRGELAARVTIEEGGITTRADVEDAFASLRAILDAHAFDAWVARPLPLMAGAVGYVGYEAGQMLERLPNVTRPGSGMPDIAFGLHRWILGACRETGRAWLSVLGRGATTESARRDGESTRDRILAAIREVEAAPPSTEPSAAAIPRDVEALLDLARVRPMLARPDYLAAVEVAKQRTAAGDAFEICLTQRLEAPFAGDPWTLYRALRRGNPAPFAAMLDLPEGAVVSASPERFLALDAERRAESRPIKGTRPRGATPEDDARLARDLASSIKDRAENAMIVDLVRSDIGRVATLGSVSVPELYAVEPYATVHQLVSTIRGELAPGRDALDLLTACFPPGSMTGAPKIEAMSILERLEPTERGVYSGALGWLDFSGTMDLSVVIRTIIVREGVAHLHVGGAVVSDSEPAAEHDETLHKARALVAALAEATP